MDFLVAALGPPEGRDLVLETDTGIGSSGWNCTLLLGALLEFGRMRSRSGRQGCIVVIVAFLPPPPISRILCCCTSVLEGFRRWRRIMMGLFPFLLLVSFNVLAKGPDLILEAFADLDLWR